MRAGKRTTPPAGTPHVTRHICPLVRKTHHVVKDVDAERRADEHALALPQLAVRGNQAGAQDGQERVEAEV